MILSDAKGPEIDHNKRLKLLNLFKQNQGLNLLMNLNHGKNNHIF